MLSPWIVFIFLPNKPYLATLKKKNNNNFIYFIFAASRGYSLVAACRLLMVVASPVEKHGL